MGNPFGPGQIVNQTPEWAKWVFRIFIALTTVAAFIVAGDPAIPDAIKVRVVVYLKGADMLILLLSKMFGVKVKEDEP